MVFAQLQMLTILRVSSDACHVEIQRLWISVKSLLSNKNHQTISRTNLHSLSWTIEDRMKVDILRTKVWYGTFFTQSAGVMERARTEERCSTTWHGQRTTHATIQTWLISTCQWWHGWQKIDAASFFGGNKCIGEFNSIHQAVLAPGRPKKHKRFFFNPNQNSKVMKVVWLTICLIKGF